MIIEELIELFPELNVCDLTEIWQQSQDEPEEAVGNLMTMALEVGIEQAVVEERLTRLSLD